MKNVSCGQIRLGKVGELDSRTSQRLQCAGGSPAIGKYSAALLTADPFEKYLREPLVLRTQCRDRFSAPCLLVLAVVPTQNALLLGMLFHPLSPLSGWNQA